MQDGMKFNGNIVWNGFGNYSLVVLYSAFKDKC